MSVSALIKIQCSKNLLSDDTYMRSQITSLEEGIWCKNNLRYRWTTRR